MALDLGTLVGRVALDTAPFNASYSRVVRQMSQLGVLADRAGAQTSALDRGLAGTAESASAAATALGRTDKALVESGISASDAAAATKALRDVTTQAGLAASRLTQAQLRQGAAQLRLAELESSATTSSRQLLMARAQLTAATDRVALAEERAGRATGLTSESWQRVGRTMLLTGGVIAAGFLVAGREMANFDARMALVRTLARASAGDMQSLRDAALTAGRAYGFTANQVADAEAELVKAGVSVKDILSGALSGALTLAAAGQENVAQATETATIAMTQFDLKGRDVPHIADLLAAGADRALGSVADLSEALKYGGLAASQAGYSLEETVGTLAEFAQAGLLGSSAGSTLQQMLRALEKPTLAAQGVMKQYGISVYSANGRMLSSSQVAGQLHDKLGKLKPAQQNLALATLFTARAVRGATILMKDGASVNEQWIKTVNAQGFAALQASGKMNSLSGDVTKLKAALQAAFIGVGENANGPLRVLVQDAANVVNAWNDLPGPVKTAAAALTGLIGAAALAGGAALLLIPKWAAMNAVLAETRIGAISARGALTGLAKVGGVVTVVAGLYIGAKALGDALKNDTSPSVDQFTQALVDLQNHAGATGRSMLTFISTAAALGNTGGMLGDVLKNLDGALAGLVTSGHADTAASDFALISVKLHEAGMSTAAITKLFPQYSSALSDSATSAKVAGTGIDQYGNAVTAAAQQTKKATDAAKAYSDRLHALSDPLFALNQALQDLKTKQAAASKATEKHGAESRQARQANLALASSSLDVETAAKSLTASVKDGSTSLAAARQMLRGWARDGLVTEAQAKVIAQSFRGLISTAGRLAATGKKAGRAVGYDFGHGMVIGLNDSTGAVDAQAAKLAMSAAAAAKRAHQSRSPSKVAMRIGRDFGAGLALGIRSTDGLVASAAAHVAHAATSGASGAAGYRHVTSQDTTLDQLLRLTTRATQDASKAAQQHAQTLADEASKAHQAAANMSGSTKAAEAAKKAAEAHARSLDQEARAAREASSALGDSNSGTVKALTRLVDAADKIAAKARTAAQNVSSAVLGDTGFGALGNQTDSFGNPLPGGGSPSQIIATLSSQQAALHKMRHRLRREHRHGLSYRSEEAIAALGLDTGGGIAATLSGATPRELRQITRLYAGIGKAGHGIGRDIAGGLYGQGIDRLIREQRGSRQLLGQMLTALRGDTRIDDTSIRRLAREIGKQFDPTIITDTPKQDHKQGQRVLAH